MAQRPYVITILFNTRDRTFLGRGGVWQSAEEFLREPPAKVADVVPSESRDPQHKTKGDPGGSYECLDDVLYYVETDPNTGETSMTEITRPCPW